MLSSNVCLEWTLVKTFSINSGHLLGLPSNLINGIGGKLSESTSCCKANVKLTLVLVRLANELSSPSTNSSIKLSIDCATFTWVLFPVSFCKLSKNVLDLSTTVSQVYLLGSFLWLVFKLDLGVRSNLNINHKKEPSEYTCETVVGLNCNFRLSFVKGCIYVSHFASFWVLVNSKRVLRYNWGQGLHWGCDTVTTTITGMAFSL